jgi:anti-sigma factor RsiW
MADRRGMSKTAHVALFSELRDRLRHRGDTLTCQEIVEMVTNYLEGALGHAEQERFERHLRTCADCVAYVEQTRRAAATLGRVEPAAPDESTKAALLEAFRDFHRD